ncbi:MAG TPA: cupredoxin family copper-binding protein [Longimicrobium sp.]|nr:cupredoxin family copper-binding protein [Longimicrobium sp.]
MRATGPSARAALAALLLCAGCAGGREPRTYAVEIRNFVFTPAALAVAPGDTVVWTNRDIVPHTATSESGGWDTGSIAANATARVVVPEGGLGAYRCAFHPTMRGALEAEK